MCSGASCRRVIFDARGAKCSEPATEMSMILARKITTGRAVVLIALRDAERGSLEGVLAEPGTKA